MKMNDKIFREYDIRGVADRDLTDEVAYHVSRAIATMVRRKGGKKMTLGRDCRLSSPRLHAQFIRGFVETGIDVTDIGLVPTPLLYFSVIHRNMDGGVMITGSHNPGDQNGFKICVGKTTIHGEDIQTLRKMILSVDFESGKGTVTESSVIDEYVEMAARSIQQPLKVKVVVDSGNGMGGIVAPKLYKKLGCEVIELYSTPDGKFPNHHPDPSELHNLEEIIAAVKKEKATLGIAFDGDADRIGVIDSSGQTLFGDEILALYARDILETHKGAKIISEVKASHRLYNDIAAHGGVPIMWKTGHSLIKAKMKEEKALLAGEMSGHMFFNDRYYGYDDAVYAGARMLEICHKKSSNPAALLKGMPPSFSTAELRVDCPDEIKFQVVEKTTKALINKGLKVTTIDGARVEYADGWGLVRASNTQPVLVYRFEATSEKRLNEIRSEIETTVKSFL